MTDDKIRELVKAGARRLAHPALKYPTEDAIHFRFQGGGRRMSIARSTLRTEAARMRDAAQQRRARVEARRLAGVEPKRARRAVP